MEENGSSSSSLPSTTGISFKLQKSLAHSSSHGQEKNEERKDFLVSVEANELHSVVPKSPPKEFIVPLIRKNIWRKKRGECVAEENQDTTTEDSELERQAAAAILKDVEDAQAHALDGEGADGGPVVPLLLQNKPPVEEQRDRLADLELRPEQATAEDYDSLPIAEFGKAMLKGMGWRPGEAIGLTNKGLIDPIEFIRRPGGLGLGAVPAPPELMDDKKKKKKNKIKLPGDEERKISMPYRDKDGRVKHVKKIGEEVPEWRPEGFYPGNFAKVVHGPHKSLCGKIVSVDEDTSRVTLRLSINHQELTFSQHALQLLTENQYRKESRNLNTGTATKQYGLVTKDSKSSQRKENQPRDHSERKRQHSPPPSSLHSSQPATKMARHSNERSEEKRKKSSYTKHDSGKSKAVRDKVNSREQCWMASHLRVRIVDQGYQRGKYYNNKVVILDVVSLDTCVCQTIDGKLLEGINQDMLETVIPKPPSDQVMIVAGKRKGQMAVIVERNKSKCRATVQLQLTKEVVTVDYDNICEYVGDFDVV